MLIAMRAFQIALIGWLAVGCNNDRVTVLERQVAGLQRQLAQVVSEQPIVGPKGDRGPAGPAGPPVTVRLAHLVEVTTAGLGADLGRSRGGGLADVVDASGDVVQVAYQTAPLVLYYAQANCAGAGFVLAPSEAIPGWGLNSTRYIDLHGALFRVDYAALQMSSTLSVQDQVACRNESHVVGGYPVIFPGDHGFSYYPPGSVTERQVAE